MTDRAGEAPPAIRIEGLHKSFGELHVLRGVDLEVADHEVICLIGASGSGKSTLLRYVNLLEPIDAGRIVVEGVEITARGVDVDTIRRRIGIVFQSFNLFPHMSVLRNITLAPTKVVGTPHAQAEQEALSRSSAIVLLLRTLTHRDDVAEAVSFSAVAKLPGAAQSGVGLGTSPVSNKAKAKPGVKP